MTVGRFSRRGQNPPLRVRRFCYRVVYMEAPATPVQPALSVGANGHTVTGEYDASPVPGALAGWKMECLRHPTWTLSKPERIVPWVPPHRSCDAVATNGDR